MPNSRPVQRAAPTPHAANDVPTDDVYVELGHLFADFLDRGRAIYAGPEQHRPDEPTGHAEEPVVITGAALGTPGTAHIFDDTNLGRLLNGEQFIDVIPTRIRNEMLETPHHPIGEERRGCVVPDDRQPERRPQARRPRR